MFSRVLLTAVRNYNRFYSKMAEQIVDNNKFTGVRLPTNVVPTHYDLLLQPDFEKFSFEGCVKIDYESKDEPQSVVVHANELVIKDGSVQTQGETQSSRVLKKVTYSTGTATLEFDGSVPQIGTICLNFSGILNEKMKGFYRTSFKIGSTTVVAATSQFEATDARRCFPCWDEPAIKATFSVALKFNKYLSVDGKQMERIALSNMPEVSNEEKDNGEVIVKFDKTPKMSTYLLAVIVGPFEAVESVDMKRPIRVYTTPGKKEHGRFALEVACKALPYYEDYFGVGYPLPKMDLIAIPDFASGAMENWGLVTYRETCVLFDPKNTSTERKQFIAIVVAHELAHQWFGNLVTMEWWTHLWLNEGFASFMEFLCVDHIFPEYEIMSQFVTDQYSQALQLDSRHNSHPIEVPVNHASEIDEIFDDISYSKGASVIRMLFNYIGDDCFRRGMKQYLTKFAYKNAVTEDLWDALEAASNKPIRKLMSGWTSKTGYPFLSVSKKVDGDKAKLTVTQSKFTSDGKLSPDDQDAAWVIPLNVVTGNKPNEAKEICLLDGKTSEVVIDGVGDSWIKFNPGTIDFYRTAYSDELLKALFTPIADRTLSAIDRIGILSDSFALCSAGKCKTSSLLELLELFKHGTEYTVWSSIDSCLGRLNVLLGNTDFQDRLHKFGRKLYADIFQRMTWSAKPDEEHTSAMTRAILINRLVSFDDPGVCEEALRRFKAHMDKTALIPADLRGAVYRAVSTHGDDQSYESLYDIYRTADLSEEKNRVARAIGFAKDPERVKKAIAFALSDEVRNQDKVFVIAPIGVTDPDQGFKFVQEYKDLLRKKYETGHILRRILQSCTENFASEEKALEVAAFFEQNKFPGAERTIQLSLETIRLNASWLARDGEDMKNYLVSIDRTEQ